MPIYSTDHTSLLLWLKWWSPFTNSSKLDVIGESVLINFIFDIAYIQAVDRNEYHTDCTVSAAAMESVCLATLLCEPWCHTTVPCIMLWELQHKFLRNDNIIQSDTKKRELLKNPTKIEEIQEKKLLTEIEPLQLAV